MTPQHLPHAVQPTILFAEDNDDLREVTELFLSAMGYRVVACSDGDHARKTFGTHTGIDMLLTDLEMPGRSGVELARELTALRPHLPVLIVSGSVISEETRQEIRKRSWGFLNKPCGLPALLTSIESALQAGAAAA